MKVKTVLRTIGTGTLLGLAGYGAYKLRRESTKVSMLVHEAVAKIEQVLAVTAEAEAENAPEEEATVAETVGDFLGMTPGKTRAWLTRDEVLRDVDRCLVSAIETLNVTAAAANVALANPEDEAQKAVRDGIEVALKRVRNVHEEVQAGRRLATDSD